MKIAIVCYPTYSGSGIVATELGLGLAARGEKVHIISYSTPVRLNKFKENIFFHSVDLPTYPLFEFNLYSLSLAGKIVEVVEKENIELIHCHYAIPHTISGIIAKEVLQDYHTVKVLTTLHGTDVTLVGSQPIFRSLVRYSLNETDAITCVSEFLYHSTIREFNPTKPIDVIHNFVDTSVYKKLVLPELRSEFANPTQKIVLHISNFRPVKRATDIVEAFYRIRKEVDSKLVLVGDGPDMPKVEALVQKLQLEKDVFCLGNQISIVELLSISDVFLLTSEMESFGLAALEAMSCKVPVVCYNVGGLPEIVEDGKSGYLVPFGDIEGMAEKTIALLGNKNKHLEFSNNARSRVLKEFDSRIILEKYLNLYSCLINEV